jgi:hypothetical protein
MQWAKILYLCLISWPLLTLEIYGTKTSIAGVPKFVTSRGFKSIVGGIPVLDIAGIREGEQNPSYVKLHGSIDWWQNDSGQIIASLEGQENLFEILTERTIIYPIYEKHVTKDPFFTLYQYFRKR